MDDEEVPIIAIIPCNPEDRIGAEGIHYNVSPFHVRYNCERCDIEGWIGPKQLTMKKSHPEDVPVLCSNCLLQISQAANVNLLKNIKALGD